jgi:hypothetical protein
MLSVPGKVNTFLRKPKMGRPPKWLKLDELGGPLRQYWQEVNRRQRQADAKQRAQRNARDKRRPKCRCEAYPWPHRPGGGFCRWPEPPAQKWQRKPGGRPYRYRYAGILRQIARASGLHPIRDRAKIQALVPFFTLAAKQMKEKNKKLKYRNIEVRGNTVIASWQTSGPKM